MEQTTETTTSQPTLLMPQEQQTVIVEALKVLAVLKDELLERQSSMQAQTSELKERVAQVQAITGDTEGEKLVELFEKTAHDYERLVENTLKEADFYAHFYQAYIEAPSEQVLELIATDMAKLVAHVANEAKLLRSYVKKRRKDFTVIFSRFDHGFANNVARLKAMKFHVEQRKKQDETHASE